MISTFLGCGSDALKITNGIAVVSSALGTFTSGTSLSRQLLDSSSSATSFCWLCYPNSEIFFPLFTSQSKSFHAYQPNCPGTNYCLALVLHSPQAVCCRQFHEFLVQYGLSTLLSRLICTSLLVFSFRVLPSSPVGVSEVHLILGSTLFLLFGLVPTALVWLSVY